MREAYRHGINFVSVPIGIDVIRLDIQTSGGNGVT